MGFFSGDTFLESAAEAFHPGDRARIVCADVDGTTIRTAFLGRGGPLVDCPFLDYFDPVDARGDERLAYAPRAARSVVGIDAWRPDERAPLVAPVVDWSRFATFDDYVAYARTRFGASFTFAERKRRKLEREVGAVEFVDEDRDSEALDLAFRWKSEQYARTNLVDAFASERTRALFEGLRRRGALKIATLRAGGRVVAVHLGAVHEGRFLYWVPAHPVELTACSPGTVLLCDLLRWSRAQDHRWFDFLLGDESYKLTFATHAVPVGPLGRAPLLARAWRPVRAMLVRPLRASPVLFAKARALRNRALERLR